MWFTFFIISACINIFLFLYIRWLLKSITSMNEDVSSLTGLILNFAAHTKSIHELEMFYGDETLQSLMKHASELSERLAGLDLVINEEEEPTDATTP